MRKEIVIIGTGGQGVKTLSDLIAHAAMAKNLWPSAYSLYTPAARDGEIVSSIVIADAKDEYPLVENPDIIVVLANNISISAEFANCRDAVWIFGSAGLVPADKPPNSLIFRNVLGDPSANLIALGIIQKIIPEIIGEDDTVEGIKKMLGEKNFSRNKTAFFSGQKLDPLIS